MSKKSAVRHNLSKLAKLAPQEFEGIDCDCVHLYIDCSSIDSIIKIIANDKNKFRLIIREILQGHYNDSLYRKEAEGVAAMKFSGQINSRVYCKETILPSGERKIIIMAKTLENKTSQKNDKKILAIIKSIQKTEYEYYENWDEYKKHESKT